MPRGALPGLIRAALVATLLVGVGALAVAGADPGTDPLRVEIRIRYSKFEPSTLSVPYGRPVTFVIRNDDPIDHEWLIGDEQMHAAHRTGTEAHHDSRPTEISIPALSTRETTITFAQPIAWQYICHLPGHEAYGMVGILRAR